MFEVPQIDNVLTAKRTLHIDRQRLLQDIDYMNSNRDEHV